MKREKRGERVFKSRGRAKETGKICGASKRQVLSLKSKHDSDHVDETGIEREISAVSKNGLRSEILCICSPKGPSMFTQTKILATCT